MTKIPFMQLYPGDYMADTQHLTTEQHGAYLLLLMTMWMNGCKLPNDDKKLARIARISNQRWHLIKDDLFEFFTVQSDVITHERLKTDYEKINRKTQKRIESGRLGGLAKSLKNKEPPLANAKATLKHLSEPEPYSNNTLSSAHARDDHVNGSLLPSDWQPSELDRMEAGMYLSEAEIDEEVKSFRDYWTGVTGEKSRNRNWPGRWRSWVRRAAENPKGEKNGKRPSPANQRSDPLRAASRSYLERQAAECCSPDEPIAEPLPDAQNAGRLGGSDQ